MTVCRVFCVEPAVDKDHKRDQSLPSGLSNVVQSRFDFYHPVLCMLQTVDFCVSILCSGLNMSLVLNVLLKSFQGDTAFTIPQNALNQTHGNVV